MPARVASLVLSPAAVCAAFGRRSVLAKSVLSELAQRPEELPPLELPSFPPSIERLQRSAAVARWKKDLELSDVANDVAIACVQTYALLVIHWLGKTILQQRELASSGESDSPFVPDAIARFANSPPGCLAEVFISAERAAASLTIAAESIGKDYFKTFYQELVPREVRHALGEYYTPDWLAEHLLNLVGDHAQPGARWLDPSCGSGTFLLQVLDRLRRTANLEVGELLQSVVGIDVHPLAVAAARLNYLLAICDMLPPGSTLPQLPILQADSILQAEELAEQLGRFEMIVGNPPWIGWETLPPDYREATRPLWIEHGLFPHRGMAAILGSGKKDLSMLLSCVATDRFLADGGWLAFLTTQAVFKTTAGAGFRRLAVGAHPTPVRITHVDDLSAVQPFPGASNRTVFFLWQKGKPTEYPVPYYQWLPTAGASPRLPSEASLDEVLLKVVRQPCDARPSMQGNPTSTWLTIPAANPAIERVVGASDYQAHEGANTGGANAVFWLQIEDWNGSPNEGTVRVKNIVAGAKRVVPQVAAELETDLLYSLLRGSDVRRWRAVPSAWLLLAQDPVTRRGIEENSLQSACPRTLAYLKQFETMLRERAAYKRYFQRANGTAANAAPFYSMFDVGQYTLAPIKVVWHRMLSPIQAAVVAVSSGRSIVPQETLAFIACEALPEAYFLAGLLNSKLFNEAAAAYSQAGGKSFASPHLLRHLRLPRFDAEDDLHLQVAAEAERLSLGARPPSPVDQSQLDELAAGVWLLRG